MAKVKTIKEIVFDMMFEDTSLMDMIALYDKAAEKYGLPFVKYNLFKNITEDINEDEYSKDEPLITVIDGKTVSFTNIEFMTDYFSKNLKYVLKEYDLYEDPDWVIFEQFVQRVISKSKTLKAFKIENIVEMVLDEDLNIMMDGNITTDMLLENIIENANKINEYEE